MLEELLTKIEAQRGNTGNTIGNPRVTATGRAMTGGNAGNIGNTPKNGTAARVAEESAGFADCDPLTHPEHYEIIEFTRWRLPSGRCVAFKLAIPKEKYDGFALLHLLEKRDQQHTSTSNDEV